MFAMMDKVMRCSVSDTIQTDAWTVTGNITPIVSYVAIVHRITARLHCFIIAAIDQEPPFAQVIKIATFNAAGAAFSRPISPTGSVAHDRSADINALTGDKINNSTAARTLENKTFKGNIMCFIRTGKGSQYKSFSNDNGNSWTPAVPAPEFTSPESPMSLKRNPANGKLYAVWNDHSDPAKIPNEGMMWKRSPLVMAESSDEGKTWKNHRILENEKDYSYCYIAILFNGPLLHLGYCCGGKISCDNPLQDTKLRTIRLD